MKLPFWVAKKQPLPPTSAFGGHRHKHTHTGVLNLLQQPLQCTLVWGEAHNNTETYREKPWGEGEKEEGEEGRGGGSTTYREALEGG